MTMTKKAEFTDTRNGYRFNVEILETENSLSINFKSGGWTFAIVDFDRTSFTPSCTTKNWNGSSNLWKVKALFGNKENLIEYARILVA
jgi:hypothetical protein